MLTELASFSAFMMFVISMCILFVSTLDRVWN